MVFRGRRRRIYRRKSSTKVAPKIKRFVRKAVHAQVENKYQLTLLPSNYNSIGNSWVENELTVMSQGTAEGNRIGNKIKLTGFHMRGTLVGGQSNLATDDNRNTVRIILALWDYSSATPCLANSVTLDSHVAKGFNGGKGLIKKYLDMIVELPSPGRDSTGYMPAIKLIKKFIKCRARITYGTGTSTTANQRLILSMLSDSAAPSNPGFTQGNYILWYEDA